ncbi:hypothetical protein E6W39_12360 [Kitasatospora acidiphila]|uniref:Uncharacterized protein n=1 Tax=Kitasatospora acidiphila TaxID=2567942 RepID=A0A540W1J9_9ACTN|nr:hypothetical protein E6W39_12360 [Kitasatospora acidiphila]
MSTYLALTFGTLLSSQGTDASFEFASAFSPGIRFIRYCVLSCFQLIRSGLVPFLASWLARAAFCSCDGHHSTAFPDQVRTMLISEWKVAWLINP